MPIRISSGNSRAVSFVSPAVMVHGDVETFAFELECSPTTREGRRSVLRALFWAAIAGLLAGATGAALLGLDYLATNAGEPVPVDELAPIFLGFMLVTGVVASIAVRAGVLLFDHSPVVAAAAFGAIAGLGPGAFGATTFGSLPLPFVGALGIVLASAPLLVVVAFSHSRSDRGGIVAPFFATLAVTVAVGCIGATIALVVQGTSLLYVLRAYQFLGLDRLGALVGAAIGVTLGAGIGGAIKLRRAF